MSDRNKGRVQLSVAEVELVDYLTLGDQRALRLESNRYRQRQTEDTVKKMAATRTQYY